MVLVGVMRRTVPVILGKKVKGLDFNLTKGMEKLRMTCL